MEAKQNRHEWIFAKGHVEPGESPADTAVRELREESGYDGRIIAPLGSLEFPARDEWVHAEYFLIETGERQGAGDGRDHRWLPYESARSLLSHSDARALLDRAARLLEDGI